MFCFCVNETLVEQPFCAMELFMLTAGSEYDHSFSELLVHKISGLMCALLTTLWL